MFFTFWTNIEQSKHKPCSGVNLHRLFWKLRKKEKKNQSKGHHYFYYWNGIKKKKLKRAADTNRKPENWADVFFWFICLLNEVSSMVTTTNGPSHWIFYIKFIFVLYEKCAVLFCFRNQIWNQQKQN